MKASEMIATIKYVEENHHGITKMYAKRIAIFQSENLPITQEVEYDEAFDEFHRDLCAVRGARVPIITAKKILNNWYIWAKDNLDALQKIKPFKHASDPIEWLIANDFRIDHAAFAKYASEELIKAVKEKMPLDSALFKQLKTVADKVYLGPRGFTYNYLVKTVAGFSESWG